MTLPRLKNSYFWPILLLLAANGLVLVGPFPALRYAGALVLLAFLPGWVWLQALLTQPRDIAERVTLAVGFSLALTIVGTMLVVYLPGPLTASQLLVMADSLVGLGLIVFWKQRHSRPDMTGVNVNGHSTPLHLASPLRLSPLASRLSPLIPLLLILLLAAALRLPRLGYAEFHEDEAEALMLGTRLFQGEDYALFLHRKGPAQMLVPVAFWLLTGQINEGLARLPFAVSSIFSAATLFFIGRRWFNWRAGAIAALLWAINGYAIGFGRMVQYQALIFFLGPLALYCLYLARQDNQPRLYFPAAILLATCLLAHFDALFLLPAAAYLWIRRIKAEDGNIKFSLQPSALILLLALLAVFYVPYCLDPEFQNTLTYLSGSRVKPGLLYNNLTLLGRLDKEYSSLFFLPVVASGLVSLAVRQSLNVNAKWRWVMAMMGLVAISSWVWPKLWQIDSFSLAIAPWLLLGALLVWSVSSLADRAAWLMFGAAFMGYVFLVDDPRTHLYIMYPGAMLLAGAGWDALNTYTQNMIKFAPLLRITYYVLRLMAIIWLGLILIYESIIFLPTESTLTRLRSQWDGSAWPAVYDRLPKARDYFGYPKREGWKAIGALRAAGQFLGDFRSAGEDFVIPIWYNYGQARSCYDTPAQFFVRAAGNEIAHTTPYIETGQVQREGEVRLRIFSAGAGEVLPPIPPIYTLEALEPAFDQRATPAHFVQQTAPPQLREVQFGPAIKFLGYYLPKATITAGETLLIDLYWQALDHPADNYRAFIHLTDGANLWGQQDDDPACRLPTSVWRAGQRSLGQFRLSIKPDTPPGRYPLIIGLYQADTLARLKITAGGQLGDDFLWLQDIEVLKR